MVLALHIWLPCMRFLPSSQEALLILLQKYLHLERTWNPSSFEPDHIPEIDGVDYTFQKVQTLSENGRKPVIIRGLMNRSKACKEAGRPEWVQKYKDFNVLEIFMNSGRHWNNESFMKTVSFQEYVEDIQRGEGGYALGFDEMLTRYPQIHESLGLEQLEVGCRSLSLQVNGGGEGLKHHMANLGFA